jgi:single-strand DNA-binding protein
MNKFYGIGNLTKDVELRKVGNTNVATFTLAVARDFKNSQGQKDTDFIPCQAWGKLGENIAKFTSKGSKIAVEGRLQVRPYEDSNGNKRTATEVICSQVEFLSTKQSGQQQEASKDLMGFTISEEEIQF